MASRRIEDLHFSLQHIYTEAKAEFIKLYPDGPEPMLSCTYRGPDEQQKLFDLGRKSPGKKVTNAKPLESPHNYLPARAFDIYFRHKDGTLSWQVEYFQVFYRCIVAKFGANVVRWGGHFLSFKDYPHYELSDWKKLSGK